MNKVASTIAASLIASGSPDEGTLPDLVADWEVKAFVADLPNLAVTVARGRRPTGSATTETSRNPLSAGITVPSSEPSS